MILSLLLWYVDFAVSQGEAKLPSVSDDLSLDDDQLDSINTNLGSSARQSIASTSTESGIVITVGGSASDLSDVESTARNSHSSRLPAAENELLDAGKVKLLFL